MSTGCVLIGMQLHSSGDLVTASQLKGVIDQEVVSNLMIARIAFRRETDPDVAPFTYSRSVNVITVQAEHAVAELRNTLLQALRGVLSHLVALGVRG